MNSGRGRFGKPHCQFKTLENLLSLCKGVQVRAAAVGTPQGSKPLQPAGNWRKPVLLSVFPEAVSTLLTNDTDGQAIHKLDGKH